MDISNTRRYALTVISSLILRSTISFQISDPTKPWSRISSFRALASSQNQSCVMQQVLSGYYNYTAPVHSTSFLSHLESVRNERENDYSEYSGVKAFGEPAMDPSRLVRDCGLDSEWLDDYIHN